MKRILAVLLVLGLLVSMLCADEKEVMEKASQLMNQKDFAKVIKVVDEGIKKMVLPSICCV